MTATLAEALPQLLDRVSAILSRSEDLPEESYEAVAGLLAEALNAECVGIYTRWKVMLGLERNALALNKDGVVSVSENRSALEEDKKYERTGKTLLYKVSRGATAEINYDESQIHDSKLVENQQIVAMFERDLPSKRFAHLVIVRLHVGEDQLGAIRVVNFFDPKKPSALRSQKAREQEVSAIGVVGSMLAVALHRDLEAQKLKANEAEKANTITDSKEREVKSILGLLHQDLGFPLVLWREGSSDDTATVKWSSPGDVDLPAKVKTRDAKKPPPHSKEQKGPWVTLDSPFELRNGEKIEAVYPRQYQLPGGRLGWLEVYAPSLSVRGKHPAPRVEFCADVLENILRKIPPSPFHVGYIVGSSSLTNQALERAVIVAKGDGPVLLLAKTGTGKELFARYIHSRSSRFSKPFVAVNCAALHSGLAHSHLFGHVKGAFTGAMDHQGYFQDANDGTLFLDEIGDIPPHQQGLLLRAIQEQTIRPVGGAKDVPINVRIIAATNKDLPKMTEADEGSGLPCFRADLYYRMAGTVINLPALKDRPEDIPALVEFGLKKFRINKTITIDDEALKVLMDHSWPGNVRELLATIQGIIPFVEDGYILTVDHIRKFREHHPEPRSPATTPSASGAPTTQQQCATVITWQMFEAQIDTDAKLSDDEKWDRKVEYLKQVAATFPGHGGKKRAALRLEIPSWEYKRLRERFGLG